MMTTPIPQQWLPGWFYFPSEQHTRFAGRQTKAMGWSDAASWLRRELHDNFDEWGAAPVQTMHRSRTAPYTIMVFEDCRAFADHGLGLRQHQGVWGSDGQRCFYIIREEHPGAPLDLDPAPPPMTVHDTAPLAAVR